MKRFKSILYILDSEAELEDSILATVQNLARLNKARVRMVKVVPEGFVDNLGKLFSSILQELIDSQNHHNTRILQIQLAHPGWKDLDVQGEIVTGRDFVTIVRKVLQEGHDLVVKARKNPSGTDPFAMHLFRKCPCPVWIIAGVANSSLKKVLAAVDLHSRRPEGLELNIKIVQLAHSLAQREKIEAHFLHVWHLQYEQSMRGARFRVSDEEIDSMKHELVEARAAAFKNLMNEAEVSVDSRHFIWLRVIRAR